MREARCRPFFAEACTHASALDLSLGLWLCARGHRRTAVGPRMMRRGVNQPTASRPNSDTLSTARARGGARTRAGVLHETAAARSLKLQRATQPKEQSLLHVPVATSREGDWGRQEGERGHQESPR